MQLMAALGAAFAGGIILNLMPCVLPVLALKIFDFVQRSGQSRGRSFAHGLTFAAGTLASFWVLAGLLLLLRKGGQQLGWGFQLQSPAFLVVLCALFFFFSLHLFGVFELGYLFTRIKTGSEREGYGGSFLSGVTATLVATPCTGPFMGTALGFAFTQPPAAAMAIFGALALGVAFPYLLLSGVPGLVRFLPKPGPWMEHLKQFMGFPLLATVIWLAWVFGRQTGVDSMAALLGLLLAAGLSAWILGKWMLLHHPGHVRLTAALAALLVFGPSLFLMLRYFKTPLPVTAAVEAAPGEIRWVPFTPARLDSATAAGRSVFIDFTADWCLSCKVNEKVAFSKAEVAKKFGEKKVLALKADWTNNDSIITQTLEGYGRNSIPLYVMYPGGGKGGYHILPQVLTPNLIIDALNGMVH